MSPVAAKINVSSVQVQIVERFEDIPLQREQWNALACRNATNTVFQTREWFDCWWHTFGREHRLWFLSLHDAGRIVGFLPLVSAIRGQTRRLHIAGASHADYVDFVVEPAYADAAIRAVIAFLRERVDHWDELRIRNLQMESPTLSLLQRESRAAGFSHLQRGRVQCPAMQITGREVQVSAMLAKYSMRRSTNWFGAHGTLTYRMLQTEAEVLDELPAFFDQHIARWAGTSVPSRFTDPAQQHFFRSLATTMAAAGWLSFHKVMFNGKPLAYHFGFRFGDHLLWYKPSFDPEFRRHSPGIVLIRRLMQHSLETGCGWIDFSIGDEAFKSRFATGSRYNTDFVMFSKRWTRLKGRLRFSLGRIRALMPARSWR